MKITSKESDYVLEAQVENGKGENRKYEDFDYKDFYNRMVNRVYIKKEPATIYDWIKDEMADL